MTKWLFILVISGIVACNAPEPKTINPVKQKFTFVLADDTSLLRSITKFDSADLPIQEIFFGNRKNDTIRVINYYYSGVLLVRKDELDRKGVLNEYFDYAYTNGILSGEVHVKGVDTLTVKYYTYAVDGSLRRETTVYPQEKINPIITVQYYDNKGNPEKIYTQIYEDSTKLVLTRYEMQSFKNTYNSLQQLEKKEITYLFGYYESADTISVTSYRYNPSGKLSAQINNRKAAGDQTDSIQFIYNNKGELDKKITFLTTNNKKEAVSVIDTTSYTYDMNSQLTEELSTLNHTGFRYVIK